jgi:predicted ribosomally synthesized peptide with SipW-like signal peptide
MKEKIMKKQENKSNKKRVIAFLLMLSLVLTSGTFAYWASYVEGTNTQSTGTLEVGSGDKVETRFDLSNDFNSGGLLVPVGQAVNSNAGAVEAIDLSFDVQWVEDEATSQMLGVEAVGQIEISDEISIVLDGVELDKEVYANIYALVNVAYNEANATELTLDAAAQTFAFQITLDEPANQEEYNLIANAEVSVTFSYVISTEAIVATDVQ